MVCLSPSSWKAEGREAGGLLDFAMAAPQEIGFDLRFFFAEGDAEVLLDRVCGEHDVDGLLRELPCDHRPAFPERRIAAGPVQRLELRQTLLPITGTVVEERASNPAQRCEC